MSTSITTRQVDTVAKLLATENIRIHRGAFRTASFNIKTRELQLPVYSRLSVVADQMFVAHEIGHALFTTMEYTDALKNDKRLRFRGAQSYMNIIEDVRVERLTKRRYPGIRKTFLAGYQELAAAEFFLPAHISPAGLPLIDRINLYFKVPAYNVPFAAEEQVFIDAAQQIETIADVVKLVVAIRKFVAESRRDRAIPPEPEQSNSAIKPAKQPKQNSDESEEGSDEQSDETDDDEESGESEESDDADESEESNSAESDESEDSDQAGEDQAGETDQDSDNDSDDSEESSEDGDTNGGDHFDDDDELDAGQTDQAFERARRDSAESNSYRPPVYMEFTPAVRNHVISYKTVLERIAYLQMEATAEVSFMQQISSSIAYLVKEFEQRKSADSYKRAQTSRSGQLNVNKLWGYKLSDDMFKQITRYQQGKNHGVVMLLDWSGSMAGQLGSTIDQLIILATFCRRINVPFQALAFKDEEAVSTLRGTGKGIYYEQGPLSLIELFSHKMNQREFNLMIGHLRQYNVRRAYTLNGTPLIESLAVMATHLIKFKAEHNIQKLTFVTLTDGESNALRLLYNGVEMSAYSNRVILVDPITRTEYEYGETDHAHAACFMSILRDRTGCNVVGFYLTNHMGAHSGIKLPVDGTPERIALHDSFRSQGFATVKGAGYDAMFLLNSTKMGTSAQTAEFKPNATAKEISAAVVKASKKTSSSRVLLTQIINLFA